MKRKEEMDEYFAQYHFYVKCMYCGQIISGTFDDASVEEITPKGHNCSGVKITKDKEKK